MSSFSAFRSITSSVRIKTLLVYLRSLKFLQANLLSRSTWCSRVSKEVSDPLFRMPCVLLVLLNGSSALFTSLLCDVTGELSLAIGGLCSVLERGSCLFLIGITSHRVGCFWMVSPADGEARDPRPASGSSASKQFEARGWKRKIFDILCDDSLQGTQARVPQGSGSEGCSPGVHKWFCQRS